MVLAATNRIDSIDPALRRPGRFDNVVYIGLPDVQSREKQFSFYLNEQVKNIDFHRLAEISDGYSCADVAGICRKIKEKILDSLINGDEAEIDQATCENVIEQTNRTLSIQEIDEYKQMARFERC